MSPDVLQVFGHLRKCDPRKGGTWVHTYDSTGTGLIFSEFMFSYACFRIHSLLPRRYYLPGPGGENFTARPASFQKTSLETRPRL